MTRDEVDIDVHLIGWWAATGVAVIAGAVVLAGLILFWMVKASSPGWGDGLFISLSYVAMIWGSVGLATGLLGRWYLKRRDETGPDP